MYVIVLMLGYFLNWNISVSQDWKLKKFHMSRTYPRCGNPNALLDIVFLIMWMVDRCLFCNWLKFQLIYI